MAGNWNKKQGLDKFKIPKGISFGNKPPSKSWSVKAAKEPPDSLIPPNALDKLAPGEKRQGKFETQNFLPDDLNYNNKAEYPRYLRSLELQPYAIGQEYIDNIPYDVYYYKSDNSPSADGWKVIVPSYTFLDLDAAIERQTIDYLADRESRKTLPPTTKRRYGDTPTLKDITIEQRQQYPQQEYVDVPLVLPERDFTVIESAQIPPTERPIRKSDSYTAVTYESKRTPSRAITELPKAEYKQLEESTQVIELPEPPPQECTMYAMDVNSADAEDGGFSTIFIRPEDVSAISQEFICRNGACNPKLYYLGAVIDTLELLEKENTAIEGDPSGRIVWPNSDYSPCDGIINEAVGYGFSFVKEEMPIRERCVYDLMGNRPKFYYDRTQSPPVYVERAPLTTWNAHRWGPIIDLEDEAKGFDRYRNVQDAPEPTLIGRRLDNRHVKIVWGQYRNQVYETDRTPIGIQIEELPVIYEHTWTWEWNNNYDPIEETIYEPTDAEWWYNSHLASGVGIPWRNAHWTKHTITLGNQTETFEYQYEEAFDRFDYGKDNEGLWITFSRDKQKILTIDEYLQSGITKYLTFDYSSYHNTTTAPEGFTLVSTFTNPGEGQWLNYLHPIVEIKFSGVRWSMPDPVYPPPPYPRGPFEEITYVFTGRIRYYFEHDTVNVESFDSEGTRYVTQDPVTRVRIHHIPPGTTGAETSFYTNLERNENISFTINTYTNVSFTRSASLQTTQKALFYSVDGAISDAFEYADNVYIYDYRNKEDSFFTSSSQNTFQSIYNDYLYPGVRRWDVSSGSTLEMKDGDGNVLYTVDISDQGETDQRRSWFSNAIPGNYNADKYPVFFELSSINYLNNKHLPTNSYIDKMYAFFQTDASFSYEVKRNRFILKRYNPDNSLVLTEVNGETLSIPGSLLGLTQEEALPGVWYGTNSAYNVFEYTTYERIYPPEDPDMESIFDKADFLKTTVTIESDAPPLKFEIERKKAYITSVFWANYVPDSFDDYEIADTVFNGFDWTEITINRPSGDDGNNVVASFPGVLVESEDESIQNPILSHAIIVKDFPINGTGSEQDPYELGIFELGQYIPEKIEARAVLDDGLGNLSWSNWIEVTPELEGLELFQNGVFGDGTATVEIKYQTPVIDEETGEIVIDEQTQEAQLEDNFIYSDAPPVIIERMTKVTVVTELTTTFDIQTPAIENEEPYDITYIAGTGIGSDTYSPDNPIYGGTFQIYLYYQSGGYAYFVTQGTIDITVPSILNLYEGGQEAPVVYTQEVSVPPTDFMVYSYSRISEDITVEFEQGIQSIDLVDVETPGITNVIWPRSDYDIVDVLNAPSAAAFDMGVMGSRYRGIYSINRIPVYKPRNPFANEDGFVFVTMPIVSINGVDPGYRIHYRDNFADFYRFETSIFVEGFGTPPLIEQDFHEFGESNWCSVGSYIVNSYSERDAPLPESYTDPETGLTWINGGRIPDDAITPIDEDPDIGCTTFRRWKVISSDYVSDPLGSLNAAIDAGSTTIDSDTGESLPIEKLVENFDNTYVEDLDLQVAYAEANNLDYVVARDGTQVSLSEINDSFDPFVNEWILYLEDAVNEAVGDGKDKVLTRNGQEISIKDMITGYNAGKIIERNSYHEPTIVTDPTKFNIVVTLDDDQVVIYEAQDGTTDFAYGADRPIRFYDYIFTPTSEYSFLNYYHDLPELMQKVGDNYILTMTEFMDEHIPLATCYRPRKWLAGLGLTSDLLEGEIVNDEPLTYPVKSMLFYTDDMEEKFTNYLVQVSTALRMDRLYKYYDFLTPVVTMNTVVSGSENIFTDPDTGEESIKHVLKIYEQTEENWLRLSVRKNNKEENLPEYEPTELVKTIEFVDDPRKSLKIYTSEGYRYYLRIGYNGTNFIPASVYDNFDPTSNPDLFFIEQLPYLKIKYPGQSPETGEPGKTLLTNDRSLRCIDNRYLDFYINQIEIINEQPEE